MIVWPDVSSPKLRKCPRHNAWIQSRDMRHKDEGLVRYCPRCDLERLQQEHKKGPSEPVKVRIMKI